MIPRRHAGAGAAVAPGAVVQLLEHVAVALRAGSSLPQALLTGAASAPGPLAPALRATRARLEAGTPVLVALDQLGRTHPVPALHAAVTAIQIGLDTGGSLVGPLEAVAQVVRDRLALDAELRALTAAGRASALVVGLAPLGFAAIAALVDPHAAASLVSTGFGRACLLLGMALDAAGGVWMRRLLRVPATPVELPELVDRLRLAAGAGLTVPAALRVVAPRAPGDVGRAVRGALVRVDSGHRLVDELRGLPARAGPHLGPLCAVLVTALDDGAPIGDALGRLAADERAAARARAQERARRVPVLLLFPLVLCILPAFVLLTVAPLVAASLAGLAAPP